MLGADGMVVLPRRVVAQPTPDVVKGGDCGACCVAGALGVSVEEVYDKIKAERRTLEDMDRVLRVAVLLGYADRVIQTPCAWPTFWPSAAFGNLGYQNSVAWLAYVRMAIDAGYYGLAQVSADRTGHSVPETDHWVLICGARVPSTIITDGTITGDVLVSCSMRRTQMQERWVEARQFLRYEGGYDLMFVRPKSLPDPGAAPR